MYHAKIVKEGFELLGVNTNYGITTIYRIFFNFYKTDPYITWGYEVKGIAHCGDQDKYNEEFGKNLAKTKAYEAYHHEVKKLMIAETYRPEWKKKNKIEFTGKADTFYDYDSLNHTEHSVSMDIRDTMWGTGKQIRKTIKEGKDIKVTIEEA